MSRRSPEPSAPSALLPALLRYVRAQGGDADLLVSRFELTGDVEGGDEAPTTASTLAALLEAASHELGDPFLALRLPEALPFRRYGPAELAARASTTAAAALTCVARYAALVFPAFASTLEEGPDEADYVQRTPAHPRGIGRAAHEYALAFALGQVRAGTGVTVNAIQAWFAHARPNDIEPLVRFFGTEELAFGNESSGFTLARSVADLPMQSRDPRLFATAQDLAERSLRELLHSSSVASRVESDLRTAPPASADMPLVARRLGMSARTLQRRLEEEGVRFSELLDRVREERAKTWLLDRSLSLTDVASRLGFADIATFSRAFKRWTGKPPGTWRRS